jgi:hypothetical protein
MPSGRGAEGCAEGDSGVVGVSVPEEVMQMDDWGRDTAVTAGMFLVMLVIVLAIWFILRGVP